MPRFVLLQRLDDVTLAVPPAADPSAPAAPTPLADTPVSFAGQDDEGRFAFEIGVNDPKTHNELDALHVGLYEKGPDGNPLVAVPDDPAEVVNAPLHFSTATTGIREGKQVVVDGTDAPEGKYVGLLVAEFAS